ncbi:hypothetical protein AVEN_205421-1 [Araneus ventricosus]|uniref:Uncharacterized protein n=1 Tax=Araneus ventricosus TaxID=182803 RepID=A0A4Y2RUR9_ARAVE|nr:hypothetical protein AVEN_205421-1 [Araneus ventricosus]
MDFRSPQARANDNPSYGPPYPLQPINGKSGGTEQEEKDPISGNERKRLQKTYFRIFDPGAKTIILGEIRHWMGDGSGENFPEICVVLGEVPEVCVGLEEVPEVCAVLEEVPEACATV